MGKNNRQRRAAKKRRKQRTGGPSGASEAPRPPWDGSGERGRPLPGGDRWSRSDPDELLRAAVAAWGSDPSRFAALAGALVDRVVAALPMAELRLGAAVDRLWGHGWTPTDVVHVVTRELTVDHARVAADEAIADGRRRLADGLKLHPRWVGQLDSLEEDGAPAGSSVPSGTRLRLIIELLGLFDRLGSVPTTIPPPGRGGTDDWARTVHLDARMLTRVRALLAKAESTTFEDEAEAFTAKAQQLIARYAIDEAMLHTVDDVGEPSVRRIHVDDPYADAKANLLAEVAAANRCRVVVSSGLGWVTAFGYDHDLDAVELLVASLLAQATGAMVRHGPVRDAAGRSRTRSFRRAFLLGFAQRIGERLRQATDEQMSMTDDRAGQLVPVLAAREDRIAAAQDRLFPHLVRKTVSASNATGWWAGQAAAEQATLEVSPHRLSRA